MKNLVILTLISLFSVSAFAGSDGSDSTDDESWRVVTGDFADAYCGASGSTVWCETKLADSSSYCVC